MVTATHVNFFGSLAYNIKTQSQIQQDHIYAYTVSILSIDRTRMLDLNDNRKQSMKKNIIRNAGICTKSQNLTSHEEMPSH